MSESSQNPIFSLLRADDMLALTFELVNLVLDKTQTPLRLIRSQPGQDAFVIMHFPPQHIAEHVFNEDTNGQPIGLVDAPVPSTLADTTRLAFRVPDTTQSIPFTLQDLLTWTAFDVSVAPNALPAGATAGPGLAAPGPQQTAIEVPYRLILSPDGSAGWKHAISPVTHDARTELWHTRLGVRNDAGSGVDESRLPAVRAIWARDIAQATPADLSGSVPNGGDRIQIAQLSSDFTMQRQPPALTGARLMLSASGAWTEVGGFWDFPTLPLHEWNQFISMGRDQHVCVANAYFCCPFGHRVLVVQVVDRKLEAAPNSRQETEYLMQRISIAPPKEGTRDYTTSDMTAAYLSQGREMPFKQVTLSIPDHLVLDNLPSRPFFPVVSGTQFRFHFSAIDRDDQQVDFTLPLLFVPVGTTAEDIENMYNHADPSLRTAELRNQIVAFTPRPPPPPQPDPLHPQSGDSHLPTGSILFTVQATSLSPPFLPEMDMAGVSVAAVDHLLGSSGTSGATIIRFHDAYLQHGFDPDKNSVQAFAQLPNSPLPLSVPADKAGGLVTPSMQIEGLTCALGPVANTASLLSGNLQAFRNSVDGHLLGGITLKQLINAVTNAPIELIKSQVPTLITTRSADAIETSFEWHPDVAPNTGPDGNPLPDPDPQGSLPPAPLVTIRDPNNPAKSTRLDISVVTRTPFNGSEPSFVVDGALSNFALKFFNVVLVTFDQLHFHAERGKKVDVSPQGVHVDFINELSLLNRLAELLPSNGFSDPPVLQVTPDGITAGYTLGIPAAGVGAFSLENIAIAAQLSLPFKDPVKLRLAFSERFQPFLVTVSLVGGGGSLAIEADTKGFVAVEGALELGANVTISLGIVEANAHVMMGFYFRINGSDTGFTFYIRIGACVDLLGLVSVSIDMYLGLTFTPASAMHPKPTGILGVVGGVAALIIGVHLLFIDKSFSLSFERHFDIPARTGLPLVGSVPLLTDPTFDEMVFEVDWQTYCQAFA